MSNDKIVLFLVDDDAVFLKSLGIEFQLNTDFIVETFATGELCVASLARQPDVIILDYLLNGVDKNAMNGIETLDKVKAFSPDLPVIMLSAQDKIEVAVRCMHHKALDYFVKSETTFLHLQQSITAFFHHKGVEKALNWYVDRM